jgi:CheY-like chemotaxis protein
VVEAEHGRAALDQLAGDGGAAPGLIVLDLLLPEPDGFAFLAALRRPDRAGSPPHAWDDPPPPGRPPARAGVRR